MPRSALPPHLKDKRHNDYLWIFKLIPRAWTSYKLWQPPILVCGYKVLDWTSYDYSCGKGIDIRDGPDPCQKHSWSFGLYWPLYFTITVGNTGLYMRIGARWDSVDNYYTIPSLFIGEVDGGLKENNNKEIVDRGIWRDWECLDK